jgi:hypothetical protein
MTMDEMTGTQLCLRMEADFPVYGSGEEKLNFLVKYAILSPSVGNTQPWDFRVEEDTVHLYLDRSRARRSTDPDTRELIISCGAALQHLHVAARKFGLLHRIDVLPEGPPERLAMIQLTGESPPTEMEIIMFYAIHKWLNIPQPFRAQKRVPDELLDDLKKLAGSGQTWLHLSREKSSRDTLADFIAEGDHLQKAAEERQKRQLSAESHERRRREDKGWNVARGAGNIASYFETLMKRPWKGDSKASAARELAMAGPVLALLGTYEDSPAAWLAAGRTLADVLLRSLAIGVRASFVNQPVQIPKLRLELAEKLGLSGYPQILFRLGFPETPQGAKSTRPGLVREELL